MRSRTSRGNDFTPQAEADESDLNFRHQHLMHDLATKTGAQQFWEKMLDEEPVKDLIRQYRDTIQDARVELEECKPADVAKLQADIRSRKELIQMLLEKKSMEPVIEAKRRLKQFEHDNSLLLGASQA